jgi:site-specific DNA-cytosine methylase
MGAGVDRVLVACEFSGIVRDAFRKRGCDAWSCDFLGSERLGPHFVGNVFDCLRSKDWGMVIAFPPCTHLAVSGARWFKGKEKEQNDAVEFVRQLMELSVPYIAIENPVGILSTRIRKPDQIIQPWQFGYGETKATCLWLKGLPPLKPTKIVEGRTPRVHHASPGPDRWKERSRTLPGIAQAMAEQWGAYA